MTDKKGGPVTVVIHGKRVVVSYGGHRFDASLSNSGQWSATKSGPPGKPKMHMSGGSVKEAIGGRRNMTDEKAQELIQAIFDEAKKSKGEGKEEKQAPAAPKDSQEFTKKKNEEESKKTFGDKAPRPGEGLKASKNEPKGFNKTPGGFKFGETKKSLNRPDPDALFVVEDW